MGLDYGRLLQGVMGGANLDFQKLYDDFVQKQKDMSAGASKWGFLGNILGSFVLPAILGITNPLLLATMAGIGSGGGQWWGGKDEAADIEAMSEEAMGATGFGSARRQEFGTEIADIEEDFEGASVKRGITSAATSFVASKGGDWLKETTPFSYGPGPTPFMKSSTQAPVMGPLTAPPTAFQQGLTTAGDFLEHYSGQLSRPGIIPTGDYLTRYLGMQLGEQGYDKFLRAKHNE